MTTGQARIPRALGRLYLEFALLLPLAFVIVLVLQLVDAVLWRRRHVATARPDPR